MTTYLPVLSLNEPFEYFLCTQVIKYVCYRSESLLNLKVPLIAEFCLRTLFGGRNLWRMPYPGLHYWGNRIIEPMEGKARRVHGAHLVDPII